MRAMRVNQTLAKKSHKKRPREPEPSAGHANGNGNVQPPHQSAAKAMRSTEHVVQRSAHSAPPIVQARPVEPSADAKEKDYKRDVLKAMVDALGQDLDKKAAEDAMRIVFAEMADASSVPVDEMADRVMLQMGMMQAEAEANEAGPNREAEIDEEEEEARMMDEARKLSEQEYDRQRERDKEVPEWLLPDEDLLSRLRKSTVLGPMCREWWAREGDARPDEGCNGAEEGGRGAAGAGESGGGRDRGGEAGPSGSNGDSPRLPRDDTLSRKQLVLLAGIECKCVTWYPSYAPPWFAKLRDEFASWCDAQGAGSGEPGGFDKKLAEWAEAKHDLLGREVLVEVPEDGGAPMIFRQASEARGPMRHGTGDPGSVKQGACGARRGSAGASEQRVIDID